MTLKVRKDLDKYKPGEALKVIVPKGGALEFTYDVHLTRIFRLILRWSCKNR